MEKTEKIEMKIGVRKDIIEKAEKYNISLENFLNVRFRKYIENVIQNRNQLKEELDQISGDEIKTKFGEIISIKEIILGISDGNSDGLAPRNDIIELAESEGVDPNKTEKSIDRLLLYGIISEVRKDKYRIIDEELL
jgi:DNA replicative helicase MCM subunit Mcm2 (Cdc46/Mcm family)